MARRKKVQEEENQQEDFEKIPNEPIKRPSKKNIDIPEPPPESDNDDPLAVNQRRSLIMFVGAALLISIIFIPGEMVWLWLHNGVRGLCSMLALFWPIMLIFLSVRTILGKELSNIKINVPFTAGFCASLNAFIYIFSNTGELSIKKAFLEGINYSGGGVLGFLLAAPLIKLCGIIPAKILICLGVITLSIFAFKIPVKQIYTNLFHKMCDKFSELVSLIKRKLSERKPKKITSDEYFDEEGYDSYDIEETNFDEDDENIEYEEEIPVKKAIASPVMSEELFTNSSEMFIEDEEDEPENDEDESSDQDDDPFVIDIDISTEEDNQEESEILANIFGDGFDENSNSKSENSENSENAKKNKPELIITKAEQKPQKKKKKKYIYPPTNLLTENKSAKFNYEQELNENAAKLISTLKSFSVNASIVGSCRGPSVTRYEIKPAPGVKISKITGLSDDIALCLAAKGGVRIEAPIPGKSAIGVEIPNQTVTSVSMRELFESNEFNKNKKTKKLECVIGKDVAGNIITMDLAAMPHLLIAGTTGSGKSVCVNSILMSILLRATPDEVKLILVDPKLVEFSKYKGIPHLLIPVVSDAKKAAGALGWAVSEMEDRYKELSLYDVKDIDSYNKMVEKNLAEMTPEDIENQQDDEGKVINGVFVPPKATKKMSKIVIAIDELADLMMVAPGEVEDYICRLAQKARAAGMHLVIATQRPSVNVITGVIKANIPSRISLKVASYVDSKTILDQGGGEKLIGKGDMLYNPIGVSKPIRVQGGFSSDDDIDAITSFIKNHAAADYDSDISDQIDKLSENVGVKLSAKDKDKDIDGDDFADSDPLLDEAIRAVVEAGQASASMLQRRLRVGYSRAGRLIDIMEGMGIVGPHEGSKSRKVLITQQEWIERKISGVAEA